MLEKLNQILAIANSSYKVIYEEKHMMNVKVDDLEREQSFVFIEEFLKGRITEIGYRKVRIMRQEISFSKFIGMHEDALTRQVQRDLIESEIVFPFISEYEKSGLFGSVSDWNIYYPLPRWDANEVSVMLEFDCQIKLC